MDDLAQVLQEIQQRRRFLVTSHARPDGDAIGSTLALGQILRKMGKSAEIVLGDPVPLLYHPLPGSETIVHSSQVNGDYDAVIILECDSVQRTRLRGLENQFLINIDHHASSRPFANINWIDPSAVATAELIFRLAQAAQVKITPEIATCLYTAVLTDTGAFCYAPTNACTFELAKFLVEHGADPGKIAQGVYFSSPMSKMCLLGAALSRLERDGEITWMSVTRHDMERFGALDEDCEGLVNYALGISGVEVAIFFREVAQERIRVSIRSKGAVNVAEIAQKFGGGGHECAGGFSTEGPVEEAAKRVLAELRGKIGG
ncbi:MAG TPA: bifunctional oligoribonuclease/PAP phosphatase NrnA [Candidatus Angelobacter sp.]|jgi:phosphoesterase RecJ-like protein|nr:bifunctional oligoribonuclease/PAP phosphatase NrnA [Candidatus Angelobacter sp.]